jgi:hypothetical protein
MSTLGEVLMELVKEGECLNHLNVLPAEMLAIDALLARLLMRSFILLFRESIVYCGSISARNGRPSPGLEVAPYCYKKQEGESNRNITYLLFNGFATGIVRRI